MISDDSFEKALEYSKKSLEEMVRRAIAPTPANFQIWYTHFSGRNPSLSHMLSILTDNNQEITGEISEDIYNRFFSTTMESDSLHETAERVQKELNHIIEYIGEAGSGVESYGKTLNSAGDKILSSGSSEGLRGVIENVLAETRKMEEINQSLERKLNDSTSEVSQLREDLEGMRREALTDSLTGIANRKMFDMELRRAARDAMESGESLSLMMVDIDHFKKFNDTFGHQVGDEVLKLLASTLSKAVKGTDIPARYGGEEFSVILPDTDLEGALSVAEGIRSKISNKKLVNRQTNSDLGKITVSIGVGLFEFGEKLDDLIKRADQALYTSKKRGRDRVTSQLDMAKDALDFD